MGHPNQHTSSSVDKLSDEELYELIDRSVSQPRSENLIGHVESLDNSDIAPLWGIAPDAIVKWVRGPSEAYTMQLVSKHTSILIPTVLRVLPYRDPHDEHTNGYWVVMDYIEGDTLLGAWDSLSDRQKERIVDDVSRFVHELRQIPLPNPPIPGPLHPDGKPVRCTGFFFSELGAGPFDSYQALADWFDRQRFRCMIYLHRKYTYLLRVPKFDRSHPLVLCHRDIHPRNIMIDKQGNTWLIDWGASGVFPPWFEFASTAASVDMDYRVSELPAWKYLVAHAGDIVGDYASHYYDYLKILSDYSNGLNFDLLSEEMDFPEDYFEKLGIQVD